MNDFATKQVSEAYPEDSPRRSTYDSVSYDIVRGEDQRYEAVSSALDERGEGKSEEASPDDDAEDPLLSLPEGALKLDFSWDILRKQRVPIVSLKGDRDRIGCAFQNRLPLVVKRVGERTMAQKNGVEDGWVLEAVNSKDVSEFHNARAAFNFIINQISDDNVMKIQFARRTDEYERLPRNRIVFFADKRNLGIVVRKRMPLVISKIIDGKWAHNHKIKPGWIIASVNDKEMADFVKFEDAYSYFLQEAGTESLRASSKASSC
jgi:hypothetical protein